MQTITSVAAWRRMLLITITALIAALAVSVSKPADAHAIVDPSVVFPSTKGWVYIRNQPVACPMIYPMPEYCKTGGNVTAWRWSGTAWSKVTMRGGTSVYAWPYASGWHWIWTRGTGWLAIRTSELTTGRTCPVGAYC